MKALMEDKDATVELGDRLSAAAEALAACQKRLDEIIWKEKENA